MWQSHFGEGATAASMISSLRKMRFTTDLVHMIENNCREYEVSKDLMKPCGNGNSFLFIVSGGNSESQETKTETLTLV